MTIRFISFLMSILCISSMLGQEKKTLQIQRTDNPPKIDGVLDDAVWASAMEAKDFTQFRPTMGVKEKPGQETVVKMTYDDNAIYIAAYLYDNPAEIMKQMTSRDNFGQSDFFLVVFNPNNDAQNDTELVVFPTGTQADAIASPSNGEDFGWNAVWDSAVKIVDDGWIVEMKVPYAVLRFANQEKPTWGLQFHRQFRRTREQYTWNPVDISQGNIGLYHGEMVGLENIQPPTRLFLYPFASALINSSDGKTTDDYSIGLDVKYGISENFTLDATLIPDFSQAGFDNVVLNLGPFEQQFSEQRQFFKEGVDLFNKGNLFYSRRVGSAPTGDVNLQENEELVDYPDKVKTLNAIKVSGRTKKGLGIGFFNAITEKTYATVRDTLTGNTRGEVVEPLANYNILVLDQQFNQNSSVSLVNTNVTRDGHFRDANVTAALFDITTKSNKYNVSGGAKMSSLNLPDGSRNGFSSELFLGKVNGNYRYSVGHSLADTKYNINDLGILFRNNYNNFSADASYRIFEPTEKLNNFYVGTWFNYNRLFDPSVYTGKNTGININGTTKKLHSFGLNANWQIGKIYDYFEPRTPGRYFIVEDIVNTNAWISTNYNKTFALDANVGYAGIYEPGRDFYNYWFGIEPRVRFSDKFLMQYSFYMDDYRKDRGFVTKVDDDIIFGQRRRLEVVNSLSGNYTFNPFHSLNLTFRNYWSTVTYERDLYVLQENGRLSQEDGYTVDDINDPNVNFNTWNLDFSYSWQFAPGSFLTALYRNQLFNRDVFSKRKYFNSVKTLFEQPIEHTLSIRLVYFIDYNNIKNVFQKKNS
ncbi:carbohydrate binding family 9 domain-containing protein [Subsaxibacter sp. CAU 1640]|uniref:DUF5916 domain-containing protein n=1 Tax=Subsaxibacter sp. CAU 1640 TaxID=2933271 RepID=UPI002003183B|nr:DUF5916 domain-containing protein [Subsaxibacter sp. CAU 1640]MCK7591077.1 carbohydrate binding family 9 domain-containing protein [Subsaxibacter sp. CAU 1640]